MRNERTLTIMSPVNGLFDSVMNCEVIIDGEYYGELKRGGNFSVNLNNNPHNVKCRYSYRVSQNMKKEYSNTFVMERDLDYVLILKPLHTTFMQRYKANLKQLFSRGAMGIIEIELVEDEKQAEINRNIVAQKRNSVNNSRNASQDDFSLDGWIE